MASPDVHGPIDFLLLEFPAGAHADETAKALFDLVNRDVIRLYDLMVVRKGADGSCHEIDLGPSGEAAHALGTFAGARSGLLDRDDMLEAANALEPGTTGALLVYENAWAVPFVAAARAEGAQVVATTRLTAQEIMDALDALEAAAS